MVMRWVACLLEFPTIEVIQVILNRQIGYCYNENDSYSGEGRKSIEIIINVIVWLVACLRFFVLSRRRCHSPYRSRKPLRKTQLEFIPFLYIPNHGFIFIFLVFVLFDLHLFTGIKTWGNWTFILCTHRNNEKTRLTPSH